MIVVVPTLILLAAVISATDMQIILNVGARANREVNLRDKIGLMTALSLCYFVFMSFFFLLLCQIQRWMYLF